jgi:caa(3)-type oxidase subunit IV
VKALLVGWFFMDLKDSSPLARLVAVSGLFWFGIMMLITLAELFSRHFS